MTVSNSKHPVLVVDQVSKKYGEVQALNNLSFEAHAGEIVGLLGDNGAGKSTIIKCISGMIAFNSGNIIINGKKFNKLTSTQSRKLGIETIYQELAVVDQLDVVGNIFLNREIKHNNFILNFFKIMDSNKMYAKSKELLNQLNVKIPSIKMKLGQLSGGQRQIVAIARAIAWGKKIILMDEPAAALGVEQSKQVLNLINELKKNNICVIFISHNLQHVQAVCDRTVILRHGMKVADLKLNQTNKNEIVEYITGVN